PLGCESRGEGKVDDCYHRREWSREDDDPQGREWTPQAGPRNSAVQRGGNHARAGARATGPWVGERARGPSSVSIPDDRGEPPPGRVPRAREAAHGGDARIRLRDVPAASGAIATQGGPAQRRRATDGCDRPGPDGGAVASCPRRAELGTRPEARHRDFRADPAAAG